jgi:hypothetical protein
VRYVHAAQVVDRAAAKPTAKSRLAGICMLFDWLVVG